MPITYHFNIEKSNFSLLNFKEHTICAIVNYKYTYIEVTLSNGTVVPVEITRSGTSYSYAVTNLSIGNRLVTSITLSSTQAIIGVNETQTITATVKPDNAENKELTWTISGSGSKINSSTTSSATVKGVTEFTKVTLTATAKDGSGKTASCTVSVPKNFAYTGNIQSFTLPAGKYKFEAWGAQGGNGLWYQSWDGQSSTLYARRKRWLCIFYV